MSLFSVLRRRCASLPPINVSRDVRLPDDTRIHFPYACCQLYSIESYSFDTATSFVFLLIFRINCLDSTSDDLIRELRNNLSIVITNDFSPKERNFDFYVSISTSMSNLDTYIPKSFSCSKCKWISLETLTSSRQSHLADCHTSHAARINEHRQSVPNENEFHF